MELSRKKVLITGGTSGIGRALAEDLVQRGAEVFVCGTRPEHAAQVQADLGVRALVCDLSTHEGVRHLARVARAELVGIDILVNNAGVQRDVDLTEDVSVEDVERELFLNFTAPVLLTSELLSPLLSSPEAAVINVTSGLALTPTPRAPIYCASKAALASYTRSLRFSLKDSNVLVTEVLPPVVRTKMNGGRSEQAMQPAEVAAQITRALEANRERLPIGQVRMLDWLVRFFPGLAGRIVSRK
jgi:uncharacterized oxidoreductase